MAALDFPASPTLNQLATLTNGFTYQWDGAVWTLAASTGQQAGGDLTGTYPNPLIGPGAVGNAEISDVAYGKITGAPAALPPSGAAGGDLTGTYPNPTVAKAAGSFSVGGNITAASTNLSMGAGPMPGLLQMLGGTDARVFLSSNHPYAVGDTTKSSWILYMDAAGDQTLIGRRAPNAAAGAVNWSLQLTSDGKTTCTLADKSVTRAMLAVGATQGGVFGGAINFNQNVTGGTGWVKITPDVSITLRGAPVLIILSAAGKYTGNSSANTVYLGWGLNGAISVGVGNYGVASAGGAGLYIVPIPGFVAIDGGPRSGAYTYSAWALNASTNGTFTTCGDSAYFFVMELS